MGCDLGDDHRIGVYTKEMKREIVQVQEITKGSQHPFFTSSSSSSSLFTKTEKKKYDFMRKLYTHVFVFLVLFDFGGIDTKKKLD